jgi:hypothetical protein
MLPSEVLENFVKVSESLLQVMAMEESYLQDSRIMLLDSLLHKKIELFEQNQYYADLLLDTVMWQQLDANQKSDINALLEKITLAMKVNMQLLEISSRGNQKIMELYFKNRQKPVVNYSAQGKICNPLQNQSVGVQHVY